MFYLTRDLFHLTEAPARPSRIGGLFEALRQRAQQRALRRRDRAAFRNLLGKDDTILRDIGVTRADVERAAGLPLSQNAALELRRIALRNR